MKFVLATLAMLPAVFADGGLRALVAQEPKEVTPRRLNSFVTYNSFNDMKLALDEVISKVPLGTCDLFKEEFTSGECGSGAEPAGSGCGIGVPSGTGSDIPELTWYTSSETNPDFDTRVEDGVFNDRVAPGGTSFGWTEDYTVFKYPALEAWGGTFDLGVNQVGTGLKITVYADGQMISEITTEEEIFWGVLAEHPISEIKIVSSTNEGRFETYTLDNMYIFPWCTPFPSGLKGDPHVETWLGDYFDFMGQCDVVYLQDKAHDIDIHARTTIRYDYSYVESAAVRIGEDVLEVSSFGEHFINGVDMADNVGSGAGYTVGGYPVYYSMKNKRTHQFDIVLGDEKNITIGTFKDLVSVSTKGAEVISYFEQSTGILGNVYGHLIGRDGETEYQIKDQKEMDVFGQEWQVGAEDPKLFQTDRAPQYPAKCIFPSDEVKEGRRLSESPIELNAAEMACARFAGATFQKCVYDVMAFGDLEVAESGIY